MSNVGSRKRKATSSASSSAKRAKMGSLRVLQPKVNRPLLDKPRPGDNTIRIERTMRQTAFTLTPTTTVSDNGGKQETGYIPFQLDQLPGYANFAACFDEYRIVKAICKFVPRYQPSDPSSNSVINPQYDLGWYHDDSGVAIAAPFLATENAWIQREGYRQVPFSKDPVSVVSYPSPLSGMVSSTGALEAAIGAPGQWISTSNVDLQHWGVKYRVYAPYGGPATPLSTGTLYVTYYVEFRQPK